MIKDNIKEFFLINPTIKLRVRHIEKEVKVPLPSAIRYTRELEKEQILKKTELAGITIYSADRTSKQFLLEKKMFNLKQLYSSGLIDYFIKTYDNPTLLVFGSYARGEDIENSDIDLYIESQHKNITIPKSFEQKLKHSFQTFHYKKIKDIKNKELANNIINGIMLNGYLEVF